MSSAPAALESSLFALAVSERGAALGFHLLLTLATSPKIPTYTADGRRFRDYSLTAVERLLSLSLVVVRRDRFGRIRVALFRETRGGHPMLSAGRFGQRYSFLRWVSERARCYEHKALPADRDGWVRDVFMQVPLSVLVTPAPYVKTVIPKVVSIASARRRPVAFNTSSRLAA